MTKDPFIQYLLSKVKPRVPLTEEQLKQFEEEESIYGHNPNIISAAFIEDMKRYLKCVVNNPDEGATTYTKRLGLSTTRAHEVRRKILGLGLASEISVNLGKKYGGVIKITEPMDKGYEYLGMQKVSEDKGAGSLEHRWWQRKIKNLYNNRANMRATIEMTVNKKSVDVGIVLKSARMIAIEVALSGEQTRNIKADVEAGFHVVVIACKNKSIKNSVTESARMFYQEHPYFPKDKVKICYLSELLDFQSFQQLVL